jgi:non-ribosomal peptide synthetase component E (peptide arylation enzyme)
MTELDVMSVAEILDGLPNRIDDVIARHVDERPQDPAFVESGRTRTYLELGQAVDAVAADFERLRGVPTAAAHGAA